MNNFKMEKTIKIINRKVLQIMINIINLLMKIPLAFKMEVIFRIISLLKS